MVPMTSRWFIILNTMDQLCKQLLYSVVQRLVTRKIPGMYSAGRCNSSFLHIFTGWLFASVGMWPADMECSIYFSLSFREKGADEAL